MDHIFITDLKLETRIGIYDWERVVAQSVLLNLSVGLPSSRVCSSDDFKDALDYAEIVSRIRSLLAHHSCHLLESLAENVAQLLLKEFAAPWVKVSIAKLAPLPGVKEIGITIERSK